MKKSRVSLTFVSFIFAVAFVVLICCTSSIAAESNSLSLSSLLGELSESHDRIHAADAAVASAQSLEDRSHAEWYPSVDLFADAGHEEIDTPGHKNSTSKFRNEQSISATQPVLNFGALDGNIGVYESLRKEAEARYSQVTQEVYFQGINAYLLVIRGREMLRYAILSEENIKRLSGMQEALVRKGAGLSYEELQVKGQLAGAQALRVEYERNLQVALNAFRAVYGYTLTEAEVEKLVMPALPTDALPANMESAIETAYRDNPGLMELQYAVMRSRNQVDVAESAYFPTVDVVVEAVRKEQDQQAQGVRYERKAGVEMNYNIFNGGGDSDAVDSARSDVVTAKKSVLDHRRTVEEGVRNAWINLITLRKNVELYSNQANITWEFLGLVKKKKSLGAEVGLLDILVGERDYISAISSKVGAEIDELIAAYTLLYQMGKVSIESVGS